MSKWNPPAINTVAVVGMGRMGDRHVEVAQQVGLRVVGVLDRHPDRSDATAARHGLRPQCVFHDLDDLLSASNPDAVVVATTADAHYEVCMAALNAGTSFLLVEKPFTTRISDALEICSTARDLDCRVAVNHQIRFTDRFSVTKSFLGSPQFGQLISLSASTGNIGLAMGASHYIEFFRLLSDSAVDEVRFMADPPRDVNPRGSQFEDHGGRLIVDASNGMRMFMDFSTQAGHGLRTVITTETGQMSLDDATGEVAFNFRFPRDAAEPRTKYGLDGVNGRFSVPIESAVESTRRLWESVLDGGVFPTCEEGTSIVRALVAAEVSHSLNGQATCPNDPNLDNLSYPWP